MFFVDNTCLVSDATFTKMKYLVFSKQDDTKPIVFEVGHHEAQLAKKVKVL